MVIRWTIRVGVSLAVLVGLLIGAGATGAAAQVPEVTGQVTLVSGSRVVINLGVRKGALEGATGVVWYELVRGGATRRITIGEVLVKSVGADTSEATIVKTRAAIQPGYFVTLSAPVGVSCAGQVEVKTDPPGADVQIDTRRVEKPTPTMIEKVCYGTRRIIVSLPRHKTIEREIEVRPGPPTELMLPLSLETGNIRLTVVPEGAEVFIDGQRAGVTSSGALVLDKVAWGPHKVRVQKSGYVTEELNIDLAQAQVAYNVALKQDICEGDVLVSSAPGNARVLLNGRDTGEPTPAILRNVPCGRQRITLALADYPDLNEMVEVRHRAASRVNLTFRAGTAHVTLTSAPRGADVYVDGRRVGTAPTDMDLEVGRSYRVRMERSGYRSEEKTVTVARAGRSEESFTLRAIEPEKAKLKIDAFGYEATGGIQTFLTLGLLTSFYAVEINGKLMFDWRIRSLEDVYEVEPGNHRLRVLIRHGASSDPVVAYDGRVQVGGGHNEVKVNFLAHTITINGYTDWFKKEIR